MADDVIGGAILGCGCWGVEEIPQVLSQHLSKFIVELRAGYDTGVPLLHQD
jgi:hypothetical protein